MKKMIIKVTLNSRNPAEAELMKILEGAKNKSAYLKMATFHYCNILGKLSSAGTIKEASTDTASVPNAKQKSNAGQANESDWPSDLDCVFAHAFD